LNHFTNRSRAEEFRPLDEKAIGPRVLPGSHARQRRRLTQPVGKPAQQAAIHGGDVTDYAQGATIGKVATSIIFNKGGIAPASDQGVSPALPSSKARCCSARAEMTLLRIVIALYLFV
jgi:hypothetical protein